MQQFWYRNAAEYDAHVQAMVAAGWGMLDWWVNPDGTMSATWEPRRDGFVPPPMLVRPEQSVIVIYNGDAQFRQGVAAMNREGWQVKSIATADIGRSLGCMLLVGIFAPKRTKYTVVFVR